MPPRRVALPLFARALIFLVINLALVGALLLGALNLRFGLAPDSALRPRHSEPMVTLASLLAVEIATTRRPRWTALLARHAKQHEVALYLFDLRGRQLAGPEIALPEAVRSRIDSLPRPPHPPFGPAGKRPPAKLLWGKRPFGKRPFGKHPPGKHPFGKRPPGIHPGFGPAAKTPPWSKLSRGAARLGRGGPAVRLGFSVRTSSPTRYWMAAHIPVPSTRSPIGRRPALLLVSSGSITGGGLFFDPWPWLIVLAAVVALSVLLWAPLVRGVTKPLRRMTEVTERIARGVFDDRLDESRGDEIGRLSAAINEMSARLSALVTNQKRFLGDIAHELGSPIARMGIGLAVLEQRAGEDTKERVAGLAEDVQHMAELVNELLSFSRAELDPNRVTREVTDVSEVIVHMVEREARRGTDVSADVDEGLYALADARLLARALSNLLRNAARYAGADGPITVLAERIGDRVAIEVRDCGVGVPEGQLSQLFEPFYRVDESRTASTGGVGLGLAIVKRCVEACHGDVRAFNLEPRGLCVRIRLEACSPPDDAGRGTSTTTSAASA